MVKISRGKVRVLFAVSALGIAALNGGLAALVAWPSGSGKPLLVGGIAAGATMILILVTVVFALWALGPEDRTFARPVGAFHRLLAIIACLTFIILIAPLVAITGGRAWTWLSGGDYEKDDEED